MATVSGHDDKYYFGRRPIGGYIPRYRNFPNHIEDYKRGWGFQVYSGRGGSGGWHKGVGANFKEKNRTPGSWTIMLDAFGECLPRESNTVTAHKTKTDSWGQPIAVTAGFDNIQEHQKPEDNMNGISGRIHEMGTARMGRDPKTSVLNGWNQSHDIPNLFITDGSFMASSAVQNGRRIGAHGVRARNDVWHLESRGKIGGQNQQSRHTDVYIA